MFFFNIMIAGACKKNMQEDRMKIKWIHDPIVELLKPMKRMQTCDDGETLVCRIVKCIDVFECGAFLNCDTYSKSK